jgi:hypothetical protein
MRTKIHAILLTLFAITYVSGQISVRINGGINRISPKDYNDAIAGRNDYVNEKVALPTKQGNLSPFHAGWNLDGEVVWSFRKNISLGLGTGYTHYTTDDRLIYQYPTTSPTHLFGGTYQYKTSVSVIPIALKIHYSQPLTRSIRLTAGMGPAVYLCSFKYAYHFLGGYMGATDWNSTEKLDAHKAVAGFEGQIGIEAPLSGSVFAEINLGGRIAKLSDFKGDYSNVGTDGSESWNDQSGGGYLFFYDYERDGKAYREYAYTDVRHPNFTRFEKGVIDLSGLFVSAGIRVTL